MTTLEQLLADFPPVSKADWLAQIERDLKGRAPDDLIWRPAPQLAVTPFVHADDAGRPPVSLLPGGSWEICEDIAADSTDAAHQQALEALAFGAEGLRFYLHRPATVDHLRALLAGVHLDYIALHFAGPGVAANPGAVLAALERLATEGNVPTSALRGSLGYDPSNEGAIEDWRYVADLLDYRRERFPGFAPINVNGERLYRGKEDVIGELAEITRRGQRLLEKLAARGLAPGEVAAATQFSAAVGTSYFMEIAKLRAFNLLWLNVLQAWQAPLASPVVEVRFDERAYTDELYGNLIRATTLAMAAVLGGARRLTVRPYDDGREGQSAYPPALGRRLARNVQHLLRLEAGFDALHDAAAGSYYIERLTQQLAGAAWEKFALA
jgi:methylmalonyl-CoA mutase